MSRIRKGFTKLLKSRSSRRESALIPFDLARVSRPTTICFLVSPRLGTVGREDFWNRRGGFERACLGRFVASGRDRESACDGLWFWCFDIVSRCRWRRAGPQIRRAGAASATGHERPSLLARAQHRAGSCILVRLPLDQFSIRSDDFV